MSVKSTAFIPASERPWFIALWKWYVPFLFRRRFNAVHYSGPLPPSGRSALVYSNHFYWWDAMTPFLLSHRVFKKQPRAVMEDKQMRRFPFFAWIGVFSVDRNEKKALLTTLRYAVDTLQDVSRCLFLYPNGGFTDPGAPLPPFEPGLHWIAANAPEAAVMPLAYFIDHRNGDKPDLYISCGNPLEPATVDNRTAWLEDARKELQKQLDASRNPTETGTWRRLL
jgi:1-acyl-sn-glycerol-3-phosphate acyltransferase